MIKRSYRCLKFTKRGGAILKEVSWRDVRKGFNFTEEEQEMILEKQIIQAMIEVRKKSNLTQSDLSKKSGIKQPNIAKLEKGTRSPQVYTLLKLLVAMGYTLQVVPLEQAKRTL